MATKYRITVDGNGKYWPQRKRLFFWFDINLGPSETIDMADASIESDKKFDRRQKRLPLFREGHAARNPIPQPTPERARKCE